MPASDSSSDESELFEVEGIVDKDHQRVSEDEDEAPNPRAQRLRRLGVRWRVRWAGYPPSDDTWQEYQDVRDLSIFKAFEARHNPHKTDHKCRSDAVPYPYTRPSSGARADESDDETPSKASLVKCKKCGASEPGFEFAQPQQKVLYKHCGVWWPGLVCHRHLFKLMDNWIARMPPSKRHILIRLFGTGDFHWFDPTTETAHQRLQKFSKSALQDQKYVVSAQVKLQSAARGLPVGMSMAHLYNLAVSNADLPVSDQYALGMPVHKQRNEDGRADRSYVKTEVKTEALDIEDIAQKRRQTPSPSVGDFREGVRRSSQGDDGSPSQGGSQAGGPQQHGGAAGVKVEKTSQLPRVRPSSTDSTQLYSTLNQPRSSSSVNAITIDDSEEDDLMPTPKRPRKLAPPQKSPQHEPVQPSLPRAAPQAPAAAAHPVQRVTQPPMSASDASPQEKKSNKTPKKQSASEEVHTKPLFGEGSSSPAKGKSAASSARSMDSATKQKASKPKSPKGASASCEVFTASPPPAPAPAKTKGKSKESERPLQLYTPPRVEMEPTPISPLFGAGASKAEDKENRKRAVQEKLKPFNVALSLEGDEEMHDLDMPPAIMSAVEVVDQGLMRDARSLMMMVADLSPKDQEKVLKRNTRPLLRALSVALADSAPSVTTAALGVLDNISIHIVPPTHGGQSAIVDQSDEATLALCSAIRGRCRGMIAEPTTDEECKLLQGLFRSWSNSNPSSPLASAKASQTSEQKGSQKAKPAGGRPRSSTGKRRRSSTGKR